MKNQPYKVSVTGIDGCGKSSSISDVVTQLSKDYLIAKVGRPSYTSGRGIEEGWKYLFTDLNARVDRMHTRADNMENRQAVATVNIINALIWSGINKNIIDEYNPDITIYGRDRIIDPAVYATYYFLFSKGWSSKTRLAVSGMISRSRNSDLLIYMDVLPEISMERIAKRIEEEKKKANIDRKKWMRMHENLKDLTKLREYYLDALDYLSGHSKIHINTIDVGKKCRQEVVSEMCRIIRANAK